MRIGLHAGVCAIFLGVFVLRVDIGKRSLNCVELVFADAASKDLMTAGNGIETPHSILADEGDRKRKILRSDHHDRLVVAFHSDPVFCVIGSDKFLPGGSVGDFVTGRYDVLPVRAQHRHDRFRITLGGADKCAGGLNGCLESLLRTRNGYGRAKKRRCHR